LGQLVLQLALGVDSEDAHDGNADGSVGPHVLEKNTKGVDLVTRLREYMK